MSIVREDATGSHDLLSDVLDALELGCPGVKELLVPEPPRAGARDRGPVFYVVIDGACRYRRADAPALELNAGDLLLLPSGGPHVISEIPSRQSAEGPSSSYHAVTGEPWDSPGRDGGCARLLQACLEYATPTPHPLCLSLPGEIHLSGVTDSQKEPILAAAVSSLLGVSGKSANGLRSVLNLLGRLVIVETIRKTAASQGFVGPGLLRALCDSELAPVMALVYQAPAQDWTLESLAAKVGMSRSSLARRFKQVVGMPVMMWITDHRMRMACRRLRDPSVGLKQIAATVGYSSDASFSAAFKRWAGHAPSECRRR